MAQFALAAASALWLGILTSISPCPLAMNITAISYIGRRVDSPKKVLSAGLLYTAGRTLTYIVLGALLVASLLSAPRLSHLLQKYMNLAMGPLLIIIGMVLLELISFSRRGGGVSEKMQRRVDRLGTWGALLLGIVFALSFCPVSAALFFGSLLALAVRNESGIVLPAVYGIGTALPVLVFAVLIAFGANRIGRAYDRMAAFEYWARRITGTVFIAAGIYYCLTYIFGFSIYNYI
jgi:cytochrome c biogenesis protein CcdA